MRDFFKRLFDLVAGLLLLVILAPLMLLIALSIKLDSTGTVFFRQQRLGRGAKPFTLFKFRTMVPDAEKMKEGLFNYADDPRVTRIGRILRSTSLDEVPQIFNVLRGEMSLVGPRPPVSYELGNVDDFDERTWKRFEVKPGVTGQAQVNGRNELSWDRKIEFDNQYVDLWRKRGVLADIPILLKTVVVIVTNKGAHEDAENFEQDAQRMKQTRNEDD